MYKFAIIFSLLICTSNVNGQLEINFTNIVPQKSILILAIYTTSESFASDKVFYSQELTVDEGVKHLRWHLPFLESGKYAVSVYQDLNMNRKLDKGMFGAPREPYGFSRNPKVVFKAPTFEDCAFLYDGSKLSMQIELNSNK